MGASRDSNFGVSSGEHDEQLVRLGMLAERYFPEDPNPSLGKLRQLGELLAQLLASRTGLYLNGRGAAIRSVAAVAGRGGPAREIAQLFGEVRRAGNAASHALTGSPDRAVGAQDQLAARALVSPHVQGLVFPVRALGACRRGRRRMRDAELKIELASLNAHAGGLPGALRRGRGRRPRRPRPPLRAIRATGRRRHRRPGPRHPQLRRRDRRRGALYGGGPRPTAKSARRRRTAC